LIVLYNIFACDAIHSGGIMPLLRNTCGHLRNTATYNSAYNGVDTKRYAMDLLDGKVRYLSVLYVKLRYFIAKCSVFGADGIQEVSG
jgi:hypothetical protein